MKPAPAPNIPGETEAERMDNAVRQIFTVSKEDILKREEEWKREQAKKKQAKDLAKKQVQRTMTDLFRAA